MNLLIIYNPKAGGGRAAGLLAPIKSYLTSHHIVSKVLLTQHPGHAVELARTADLSEYDGVIASGGDGTLFEVLNGYMANHTEHKPPIGLIPNGTGNAFMKELGLTKGDWQKAIDIILKSHSTSIDIGKLSCQGEVHYFANIVGMGFVSKVAQAAIPLKWLGKAAYTVATLFKMINLKAQAITLEIDGETIQRQGVFVEVANSRYTGTSFLMAPEAKLNDGMLDVVLLNQISRLKLLRLFNSIYQGAHINYEQVETFKGKNIKVIEAQSSRLIPDGEVLGQTPAEFECLHAAVEFFWPLEQALPSTKP
jgi:diacylglycerol kinase (ATP)